MSWNFEGRYPFRVQMILGKKNFRIVKLFAGKQKKTLAIILHVIHSNTTENHYNFAAAQPLVSNKMLYLWPIIWKIEFCYLYLQYWLNRTSDFQIRHNDNIQFARLKSYCAKHITQMKSCIAKNITQMKCCIAKIITQMKWCIAKNITQMKYCIAKIIT